MRKSDKKQFSLLSKVLASTLFVAPYALANTIINSPQTTTQSTNGADNNTLEILQTGSVATVNTDAIQIDSIAAPGVFTGGIVIIDPVNNKGKFAVSTTGTGIGVHFEPSSVLSGGRLEVGAGSGITTKLADSVFVDNNNDVILNAGTIQVAPGGTGVPIHISANATFTVITNEYTGLIDGRSFEAILTDAGAPAGTLILNNFGIVDSVSKTNATIQLNSPFISINNLHNGSILGRGPAIINVAATSSGKGDIINQAGALIQNVAVGKDAINVAGPMDFFFNGGSIIADNDVLVIHANMSGIENTNSMISSAPTSGATIFRGPSTVPGSIVTISGNGLVNSGEIISGTPGIPAIDFHSNEGINPGEFTHASIFQEGGVIHGDVLLAARDSQGGPNVFTMSGGNIAGNVLADTVANNTFFVSGGILGGDLVAGQDLNSNIFVLSGGAIAGTVQLNELGPGDTVFLSGTALNQLTGDSGNDFINITGGSFNLLSGGINGPLPSTVNIDATFTANGTISNFQFINVNNEGTIFTANDPILNVLNFNVNADTTFITTNFVSFSSGPNGAFGPAFLSNNGTIIVRGDPVFDFTKTINLSGVINQPFGNIVLEPTSSLTILSPFDVAGGGVFGLNILFGAPGSTITPEILGPIGGPPTAGQIIVDSTIAKLPAVTLAAGSFIEPVVIGFVPQNATFDIITLHDGNGGFIVDNSTLIQPPSAIVSFTKELVDIIVVSSIAPFLPTYEGQILRLVAHRNSFASISDLCIASTLDVLAQGAGPVNNDLFTLLVLLDHMPQAGQIEDAIVSLVPPFNYGLIEGSHITMESVFDGISDRVWDVAWHHPEKGRRHRIPLSRDVIAGGNYGDNLGTSSGFWMREIGIFLDQSERDSADGYKGKGYGGVIGWDWGVTNCTTVGAALSYAHINIDDKSDAPKDEAIKSWQGTLYGSLDFANGFYMDLMGGLAFNDYDLNRVISVGTLLTGAQASFKGTQWGIQSDLGWGLPGYVDYVAPFVRLRYVHLEIDDYTETGAGDLSLIVANQDAKEFLGGIGVKFATAFPWYGLEWVPELTLLLAYDFENDGEQAVASFLGGGPAFCADGVVPSPTVFDIGLLINAMCPTNYVITAKYNIEFRDKFVGNAAYLQYFMYWS